MAPGHPGLDFVVISSDLRHVVMYVLDASLVRATPEYRRGESVMGSWEFVQLVNKCFVNLEKAFNRVTQVILLGGAP